MSPSLLVLFTDERWLVRKGRGGQARLDNHIIKPCYWY